MAEEGFKRKLAAILSADVVGYSHLMEDNEDATIQTLNTYRNSVSTLVQQHRGRVVDMTGDNLMAEFSSVVDAVKCAVETQKEMSQRNADLPESRRMLFRIGVNLGDIVEEENGFIRFVGRNSETINIGGQKVLPVEIENVLEADPNVLRATVKEACSSLGLNFVEATIELIELENHRTARGRLRKLCLQHLSKFKVPSKFYFREVGSNLNARFKKVRKI